MSNAKNIIVLVKNLKSIFTGGTSGVAGWYLRGAIQEHVRGSNPNQGLLTLSFQKGRCSLDSSLTPPFQFSAKEFWSLNFLPLEFCRNNFTIQLPLYTCTWLVIPYSLIITQNYVVTKKTYWIPLRIFEIFRLW